MSRLPSLPEQHLSREQQARVWATVEAGLHDQHGAGRAGRRHRRLAIVAAVGVVVVAAGGTAAALGVFGSATVTDHSTARCYYRDVREFGGQFPGTTVAAPKNGDGSGGEVIAPVSACTQVWQLGLAYGIAPPDAHPPYKVPPLAGCVLPDGTAGVFPGGPGTCQQLGLPTARHTR